MLNTQAATQPKRLQCRHIFTEGRRCGSPCLRGEDFCYYHHTSRKPVPQLSRRRARQGAFTLPMPEDRAAIQLSIGEVLARIAANRLDPRRAGLLLYGLQIALQSLPKPVASAPARSSSSKQAQPQAQPHVEEIVLDPTHGLLAPEAEFAKDPATKTLKDILMEQWARDKEEEARQPRNTQQPTPVTEPGTLPALQASTSHPSSFRRSGNPRIRFSSNPASVQRDLKPIPRSTHNPGPCKTLRREADVAISYLPEEQKDAEEVAKYIRDAGQKAVLLPETSRMRSSASAWLPMPWNNLAGSTSWLTTPVRWARPRDPHENERLRALLDHQGLRAASEAGRARPYLDAAAGSRTVTKRS